MANKTKSFSRVIKIDPFAILSKVSRSKSANSLWVRLGIKSSKSSVWIDKDNGFYYIESDYKTYKSQKIVKRSIENKAKKMRSKGLFEESVKYLQGTFLANDDSSLLTKSKEYKLAKRNIISTKSIGANVSGKIITVEDFARLNSMIESTGIEIEKQYGETGIVIDISLMAKLQDRYGGETHVIGIGQMSTGAFIKRGIKSIESYMRVNNVLYFPVSITVRKKDF